MRILSTEFINRYFSIAFFFLFSFCLFYLVAVCVCVLCVVLYCVAWQKANATTERRWPRVWVWCSVSSFQSEFLFIRIDCCECLCICACICVWLSVWSDRVSKNIYRNDLCVQQHNSNIYFYIEIHSFYCSFISCCVFSAHLPLVRSLVMHCMSDCSPVLGTIIRQNATHAQCTCICIHQMNSLLFHSVDLMAHLYAQIYCCCCCWDIECWTLHICWMLGSHTTHICYTVTNLLFLCMFVFVERESDNIEKYYSSSRPPVLPSSRSPVPHHFYCTSANERRNGNSSVVSSFDINTFTFDCRQSEMISLGAYASFPRL